MKTHSLLYIQKLTKILNKLDIKKIDLLKNEIKQMIGTKRTLFICGNGGSAATASHMACDLGKTILGKNPKENIKRLRVICLNDNIPLMTAWGNDEGYEYIFSEQLKNLGKSDDLLIAITGSGNSKNILEVIRAAKKKKIKTIGILGFDGGKVKNLLDEYILVKSSDYGLIEDIHCIIGHLITDYFKQLTTLKDNSHKNNKKG